MPDSWTHNNRAATTTWLTLRFLAQIPKDLVFAKAGTRTMQELLFWTNASSAQARRVAASGLIIEMDSIFRDIRGAQYENGKSLETAVNAIRDVLLNADKTVADLAVVNDEQYRFWQED